MVVTYTSHGPCEGALQTYISKSGAFLPIDSQISNPWAGGFARAITITRPLKRWLPVLWSVTFPVLWRYVEYGDPRGDAQLGISRGVPLPKHCIYVEHGGPRGGAQLGISRGIPLPKHCIYFEYGGPRGVAQLDITPIYGGSVLYWDRISDPNPWFCYQFVTIRL